MILPITSILDMYFFHALNNSWMLIVNKESIKTYLELNHRYIYSLSYVHCAGVITDDSNSPLYTLHDFHVTNNINLPIVLALKILRNNERTN